MKLFRYTVFILICSTLFSFIYRGPSVTYQQTIIRFCTDYRPKNPPQFKRKSISDSNQKSAVHKAYKLAPNTTMKVFFHDGEESVQIKVIEKASEWSQFCSIKFELTNNIHASDIRISFRTKGYWSNIGSSGYTDLYTMSLENLDLISDEIEFKRVVLHEFGHALGLVHEHQSPKSAINWNKDSVYKYYSRPPNQWSRKMVDEQIFNKYSKNVTNSSDYDPQSIMQYPIPPGLTLDNYVVGWNNELSEKDKEYIKSIYPF